MKATNLISVVSIHILFAFGSLHAQEAIPPTGGDASSNGISVSYKVGLFAIMDISEYNGYVFQ